MSAPNPFAAEVLRLAPRLGLGVLGVTASTVTDEASLRAALAGLPPEVIDRAVARALAWETLTPLERAILDLTMATPMTIADRFAALPDPVRPVAAGGYATIELEVALVRMQRQGLLEVTGYSEDELALLEAWALVPEEERQALYRAGVEAAEAKAAGERAPGEG